MKIRMYATILSKFWNPAFLVRGIKAGETGEYSNEKSAILVQSQHFFAGQYFNKRFTQSITIIFEKEASEIYLDYDDGVELIEKGIIKDGEKTYASLEEGFDSEAYQMYGSYVKEISAEEIVGLTFNVYDRETERYYINGREE